MLLIWVKLRFWLLRKSQVVTISLTRQNWHHGCLCNLPVFCPEGGASWTHRWSWDTWPCATGPDRRWFEWEARFVISFWPKWHAGLSGMPMKMAGTLIQSQACSLGHWCLDDLWPLRLSGPERMLQITTLVIIEGLCSLCVGDPVVLC